MVVDAAGRVRLVSSVPLLHPEQQMLEEMLEASSFRRRWRLHP
jgi:hypothetical protein